MHEERLLSALWNDRHATCAVVLHWYQFMTIIMTNNVLKDENNGQDLTDDCSTHQRH